MNIEIKLSKRPVSYQKAMKLLDNRVKEIKKNKNNELLWLLEHPVTYTAGVRFLDNEILDKKIKIVKTNRGGKITLHNPGQKIIYFAINESTCLRQNRCFEEMNIGIFSYGAFWRLMDLGWVNA